MSFPEFGVSNAHVAGVNRDNPLFIERAYNWIQTHDVAYVAYARFY